MRCRNLALADRDQASRNRRELSALSDSEVLRELDLARDHARLSGNLVRLNEVLDECSRRSN